MGGISVDELSWSTSTDESHLDYTLSSSHHLLKLLNGSGCLFVCCLFSFKGSKAGRDALILQWDVWMGQELGQERS